MLVVTTVHGAGRYPTFGHVGHEAWPVPDQQRVQPPRRAGMRWRHKKDARRVMEALGIPLRVGPILVDHPAGVVNIRQPYGRSDVVHVVLVANLGDVLGTPKVSARGAVEAIPAQQPCSLTLLRWYEECPTVPGG